MVKIMITYQARLKSASIGIASKKLKFRVLFDPCEKKQFDDKNLTFVTEGAGSSKKYKYIDNVVKEFSFGNTNTNKDIFDFINLHSKEKMMVTYDGTTIRKVEVVYG